MEIQLAIQSNSLNAAIELNILDIKGKEKKVLMFFNQDEDWNGINAKNILDKLSFFAGGLMKIMQKDKTVIGYEATAYRVIDGSFTNRVCFCPCRKDKGEFKPVLVNKDGSIEFI